MHAIFDATFDQEENKFYICTETLKIRAVVHWI